MNSSILPIILVLSITLQLASAGLALLMIFKSGFYLPWIPLSAAILLMGIRRIISFAGMVRADRFPASALDAEIVALVISILMLTGLYLFAPAFKLIRKRRDDELEAKDLLIRESHHHVKNDLQFLNSIVGLQQSTSTSEHEKNNLQDLGLRIQSFAMVHEYLYSLGSKGLPCREYFAELLQKVSGVYGGREEVKVELDIDDITLHHKDLQYCGLIVNEALTNSYKYAFKDAANPMIRLSLKQADSTISLSIADNGPGLPEEVLSGKESSFGLAMIRGITSDPEWKIEIRGTDGTTISARFPMRVEQAAVI